MGKGKHITISNMKNAIDLGHQKLVSQKDEEDFIAKMSDSFDERFGDGNIKEIQPNLERKKVRPKRSMKKDLGVVIGTVACALICAFAITGGITNTIDPIKQNTNPNALNSGQADNNTSSEKQVEESVTTVTERAVETEGQDANTIEKGTITLTGGQDGINYINPKKSVLAGSNIAADTINWTIKTERGTTPIYSGSGSTVDDQLIKMIKSKKDGLYIITYKYKDKSGNGITVHKGFEISTK